jgi:hypothetical protein
VKVPGRKRGGEQPREAEIGKRGSQDRKLGWGRRAEITAAVLGIVALGFTLGPKIEAALDGADGARLEIDEITLSNPPAAYFSGGAGPEQDPATEPTIAATVRNRGKETAWIEEARVTVIETARLSVCLSQGGADVPQSKRYRISLPEFPREGHDLVRRDLHVEVQPGHGARTVLSFQNELGGTTNLYAIRVQLVADPGDRVVDAGRFVIGVPEPISRSGLVLPENDAVLRNPASSPGGASQTWCFRHNLEGMRRVVGQPGRRSDYVAALARMRVASAWADYMDRRPPRVAIEELLRIGGPEGPLYATEAALQTGDPGYEKAVRERAIQVLLRQAAEKLDDFPGSAAEDAERALSLVPSLAAARLLSQAKAAKRAEEERQREELQELEGG